jgi:restriction system protein
MQLPFSVPHPRYFDASSDEVNRLQDECVLPGKRAIMTEVPAYHTFFEPVIEALVKLGGSGTTDEINAEAIKIAHLPDSVIDEPHIRHRGTEQEQVSNSSEVEYRLTWARSYLKMAGFLTSSARSVWALTEKARVKPLPSSAEIIAIVRSLRSRGSETSDSIAPNEDLPDQVLPHDETTSWRDKLTAKLLSLHPSAFERLTQRLLREAGFVEVKVTGRTGDGGIDGRGIVRLQNVVSLHAIFQCKRYSGSVAAEEVRQFRGAMTGRSDYGIFLTTGRFTRGALLEASRDGAPPIDLIDGERLVDMLKDLRLGITLSIVEQIDVDDAFFAGL